MPGKIVVRSNAREDTIEQALYIAEDSPDAAERFLDAAQRAFEILSISPSMGAIRRFDNPALSGVRMWPIEGFEKHLIFYRPLEGGIEVIRVLHAARDLESILDEPG